MWGQHESLLACLVFVEVVLRESKTLVAVFVQALSFTFPWLNLVGSIGLALQWQYTT